MEYIQKQDLTQGRELIVMDKSTTNLRHKLYTGSKLTKGWHPSSKAKYVLLSTECLIFTHPNHIHRLE